LAWIEVVLLVLGVDWWLALDYVGELIWERHACILVTPDQSLIHSLVRSTLSLETWKRHQLPLLEEEISSIFTGHANLLQLLSHKLSLFIAYAL
jgi:hypothetical protein